MPEKTHWEGKPSWKVVILWALYLAVAVLVIGTGLFKISRIVGDIFSSVFAGFCILVIIFIIYLVFLRKTYCYSITNKKVCFKGGIITKKQKLVPYHKITNVVVSQNILEQVLGISKIGFQTAGIGGKATPEITFEGLVDAEKPKKLVEQFLES